MQLFNEESFSTLLTNCYENTGYQGVIMLFNEAQKRNCVEEVQQNHNENPIPGVSSITARVNHCFIAFENNSKIEIITPNNLHMMRGCRFNEALLGEEILDFDAINMLERMIFEYTEEFAQHISNAGRTRFWNNVLRDTRQINIQNPFSHSKQDNPDIEIKVDRKSKEVIDDFLDSFKITNSLEFG